MNFGAPSRLFRDVCSWSVNRVAPVDNVCLRCFVFSGLSKAETQALNNYGSGEDENEEEEMEEFEAGPVDVQTSLQASADGQVEQEVGGARGPTLLNILTLL